MLRILLILGLFVQSHLAAAEGFWSSVFQVDFNTGASGVVSSPDSLCPGGSTFNASVGKCLDQDGLTKAILIQAIGVCPGGFEAVQRGPETGVYGWQKAYCVAPSNCEAGQTRSGTTGQCVSDCSGKSGTDAGSGWYTSKTDITGTPYCKGGCVMTLALDTSVSEYYYSSSSKTMRLSGMYTGASCSGSEASAPSLNSGPQPPQPPKKTPCADGEGVMTSTSGNVRCVPPGTPSSSTPVVQKTTSVQSFPDGSTKTTETIKTTDPATGTTATDQRSTVTAGGGGSSQAGNPGTTTTERTTQTTGGTSSTGTGTGTGNPPSSFCAENPNSQICKGDMATEKTAQDIRQLLDPTGVSLDPLAQIGAKSETEQQLSDVNKQFSDVLSGQQVPGEEHRSAWREAMASGWFDGIPAYGCEPLNYSIFGREWVLDACPAAERVSGYVEFAMWFSLVVGVFVTLSGGRTSGDS